MSSDPCSWRNWATSEVIGTTSVGKVPLCTPGSSRTAGADARQLGEARVVGEVVLAAEAADRHALVALPGQRRMLADGRRQLFEDPVHLVLARGRVELVGVDEQVDVLGEAGDQSPALGEAGAALEHRLVAEALRDDAQDLGDVVVLLDELLADAEVLGGAEHRLLELGVLEQPHLACHSLA